MFNLKKLSSTVLGSFFYFFIIFMIVGILFLFPGALILGIFLDDPLWLYAMHFSFGFEEPYIFKPYLFIWLVIYIFLFYKNYNETNSKGDIIGFPIKIPRKERPKELSTRENLIFNYWSDILNGNTMLKRSVNFSIHNYYNPSYLEYSKAEILDVLKKKFFWEEYDGAMGKSDIDELREAIIISAGQLENFTELVEDILEDLMSLIKYKEKNDKISYLASLSKDETDSRRMISNRVIENMQKTMNETRNSIKDNYIIAKRD